MKRFSQVRRASLLLVIAATSATAVPQPSAAELSIPMLVDAGPEEALAAAVPPLRVSESLISGPGALLTSAFLGARDQLAELGAWNRSGRTPTKNGFARPIPTPIGFQLSERELSLIAGVQTGAGIFIADISRVTWGTSIAVENAYRLRVELEDIRLPEDASIWVWGEGEAPVKFELNDLTDRGSLWSPSVSGPVIHVEATWSRSSDSDRVVGLQIRRIIEVFELENEGTARPTRLPTTDDQTVGCLVNAACVTDTYLPNIALMKKAVAHLQFVKDGSSFICTGTLLNNSAQDGTPYLLTANHCLDTQAQASSLEAFWDFILSGCPGAAPNLNSLPRSSGGTLLATSSVSDFTLLRLQNLPAGRVLLGWNTAHSAIPMGQILPRLHHPLGLPMMYSESVAWAPPQTCGLSTGNFVFSDPRPEAGFGATFGGSSGSALLLPNGQVVGQLGGVCGPSSAEPCLAGPSDSALDGRFSISYPAIAQYLNPVPDGDTSPCVASSTTACFQNGRFEAKVTWTTVSDTSSANVMVFGGQRASTEETAFFQFFSPTNFEMGLKILNACIPLFNNKYWIFISGLTDQGWSVRIRDTSTGQIQTYINTLGTLSTTFRDQSSFSCN